MRDLFISERRCIANLSQAKWGAIVEPRAIVREYCCQPGLERGGQAFNSDFNIEFFDRFADWPDSVATAGSILPNALGGEIFLIVEKGTLCPMVLKLVGGDAFHPKHYSCFADQADAAVRAAAAITDARHIVPSCRNAIDSFSVERSRFVRLLVVGEDITFLCFPEDTMPVVRGLRVNLVKGNDREIDVYVDGGEIVCFDGWVRTEVTTSDLVLVCVPKTSE